MEDIPFQLDDVLERECGKVSLQVNDHEGPREDVVWDGLAHEEQLYEQDVQGEQGVKDDGEDQQDEEGV